MQTGNIQRAIDDCFARGGGTVTVPSGEFLTGGLRLCSNATLKPRKGAVFKDTRDIKEHFGYRDDKIEPLDENILPMLCKRLQIHRTEIHPLPQRLAAGGTML